MDISKYIKGRGVEVSREKTLGNEYPHYFVEPNNFYSLKDFCNYESLDFVYAKDIINETKFFRILVKEWMNFSKVGGHIIIEINPNNILNFEQLVGEVNTVIREKGEIIEKDFEERENRGIVIIKKKKPILLKGDSIDKWTFGIITGGITDNLVDKTIESILKQKISNFEIIICGIYNGKYRKNKNVKLIYFDCPLPWITRKKNLICEKAKYENLMIIHDHISLKDNWYSGMKKYGNYWEVLVCVMQDPIGRNAVAWMTYGIPLRPFSKYAFLGAHGGLEFNDWDKNVNIGGLCMIKKSIWKICPWDERLLLWMAEDMKISGDFYENGIVPRFNPFSNVETNKKEWGNPSLIYKFNKYKLGRPIFPSLKIMVTFYIKNFIYKKFGVYLKRPDSHNEMQRTFAVPMKSQVIVG